MNDPHLELVSELPPGKGLWRYTSCLWKGEDAIMCAHPDHPPHLACRGAIYKFRFGLPPLIAREPTRNNGMDIDAINSMIYGAGLYRYGKSASAGAAAAHEELVEAAKRARPMYIVDQCFRDAELRIMADMLRRAEEKTLQDTEALLSKRTNWPTDAWRRLYTSTHQNEKETSTMSNTTIQAINKLEGPVLDAIHAYGDAKHDLGAARAAQKIAPAVDTWYKAGKADDARNAALVLIADAIDKAGQGAKTGPFYIYVDGIYYRFDTVGDLLQSALVTTQERDDLRKRLRFAEDTARHLQEQVGQGHTASAWDALKKERDEAVARAALPQVSGEFYVRGTFRDICFFANVYLGRLPCVVGGLKLSSWDSRASLNTRKSYCTHSFAEAVKVAEEARSHPHYRHYPVTIEPVIPGVTFGGSAQDRVNKLEAGHAQLEINLASARADVGAKQRKIDSQAAAIRGLEAKVKEATTVLAHGTQTKFDIPFLTAGGTVNVVPQRYFVLVDWEDREGVVLARDGTAGGLCSSHQPNRLDADDRKRYALEWDAALQLANDARTKPRYSNVRIVTA